MTLPCLSTLLFHYFFSALYISIMCRSAPRYLHMSRPLSFLLTSRVHSSFLHSAVTVFTFLSPGSDLRTLRGRQSPCILNDASIIFLVELARSRSHFCRKSAPASNSVYRWFRGIEINPSFQPQFYRPHQSGYTRTIQRIPSLRLTPIVRSIHSRTTRH